MATPSNTYTNPGTVAGGKPMYPTPMRPTRTPDAQSPTPQTPMSADPLFQNVYQRAQENLPQQPNNGNPRGANNMPSMLQGMMGGVDRNSFNSALRGAYNRGGSYQNASMEEQRLADANPSGRGNSVSAQLANMQQGLMGRPGAGQQYPLPQYTQQQINMLSGQQSNLGRYRPPTLAGDGNNPMNWNDAGGYAYNLPYAFGPRAQNGAGPYGGYPSYLLPNWRTTPGWG